MTEYTPEGAETVGALLALLVINDACVVAAIKWYASTVSHTG